MRRSIEIADIPQGHRLLTRLCFLSQTQIQNFVSAVTRTEAHDIATQRQQWTMAKDPGNEGGGSDASKRLSHCLDSFEKASSEHKKTIIIIDHIVPFIQSKGIKSPRNHPSSKSSSISNSTLSHCLN
jgi:hypothetical protein